MIVKTDSSSASFCKVTFVVRSFHSPAHHSLSRRQFHSKVEATGRDEGTAVVPDSRAHLRKLPPLTPGHLTQRSLHPWLFGIGEGQSFVMCPQCQSYDPGMCQPKCPQGRHPQCEHFAATMVGRGDPPRHPGAGHTLGVQS